MSERLTDEELEVLLVDNGAHHPRWPDAYALASEVTALVAEVKERRATDLTASDLVALRIARRAVRRDHHGDTTMEEAGEALDILYRLIAAAEARRG